MPKSNKKKMNRASRTANGASAMVLSWRTGSAQPPAFSNRSSYVNRKIVFDIAAAGSMKIGDIATALGSGGDFTIKKISCWGTPATVFGSTTFIGYAGNLLSGATAADIVTVTDSGTGTNRPSVVYTVPPQRAIIFNRDTAATTLVVDSNTAATFHVDVQQYVV
jgi:hypothetical protein